MLTSPLALATSAIIEMTRVRLAPGGAGPMTLPLMVMVVGAAFEVAAGVADVGAAVEVVGAVVVVAAVVVGPEVEAVVGGLALAEVLGVGAAGPGAAAVGTVDAGVDAGGLTAAPLGVADEAAGGRAAVP